MQVQHPKRIQPHMYPGQPVWHAGRPHQHFVAAYGNPFFAQQHHPTLMLHHKNVTESKPRFAKHEVEALEAEFQLNHKPNSLTKRGLAEKMGVEVPRINNWFQNRRAKEKHDLKLREYEKQQREDKRDVVDPTSSTCLPADTRPKDSASEAQSLVQQEPHTTISTAVMGGDDGDAEVTETPSPSDESVLQSSEDVSEQLSSTESSPALHQEPDLTPASELDGFHFGPTFSNSTSGSGFDPQEQLDLSNQDDVAAEGNMFSTPYSDNSEFQALPGASYIHYDVPTFPSESFLDVNTPMPMEYNDNSEQYGGGYPFRSHATSTMPMSQLPPAPPAELCFKPHRSIAERRKRQRPAELGDFSKLSRSQGPKTGIEMGRRLEHPAPMRRTASATGMYPVGISKASACSYNVKQESLLLGLRSAGSPTLTDFSSAIPPTSPRVRELTPAMSSSSEDHNGHYHVKSEPYAMHTPPKTPGLHLNLPPPSFSITADGFGHGLDESLLTPGLVRDGSELEFPGGSNYHPIPRYAASQPVTPGFAPHNFGPSYMWGAQPTNHASEYRFPDSSTCYVDSSARSSPGGQHLAAAVSFQFAQNITPQDFRGEL